MRVEGAELCIFLSFRSTHTVYLYIHMSTFVTVELLNDAHVCCIHGIYVCIVWIKAV